ncbi:MAG: LysR family transcriptional regulator [Candidatus Hydrogenedentes bacterium]|nr:LysR family transcriptional regulator [Candidatus Hydrogenedentota bacterium]
MDNFSPELLECYCALVETGSFARAGKRIGRSQPAVSQRIKELENSVGLTLYDRKKKSPTVVGKKFYELARGYLRVHRRYNLLFGETLKGAITELKIGSSDSFACYILPETIRRFFAIHPDLQLSVMTRNSNEIENMVIRGEVNLGIVAGPVEFSDLEQEIIYTTFLKLVIPNLPKFRGKKIGWVELGDIPFVSITPTTRTGRLIWEYLRMKKIYPRCVIDSGSFSVVMEYVSQGFGYSIVPEMVAEDWRGVIKIGEIKDAPNINFFCIYPRGFPLSEMERNFIKLLKEVRSSHN